MNKCIKTLLFLTILSCNEATRIDVEILELEITNSNIPEGIAVHPKSKEIFLSSVHNDQISKSSRDGKSSQIILTRDDNGYSFGVGMEIWNNKLYALSKRK